MENSEKTKKVYTVTGMNCAACDLTVDKAVK